MSAGSSRRGGGGSSSSGSNANDDSTFLNAMENRKDMRRNIKKFTDFLDYEGRDGSYRDKVRAMVEKKERRLLINIDHLREFDSDFTHRFILNPNDYFPAFQDALKTYTTTVSDNGESSSSNANQKETQDEGVEYFIGVEGSFGSHHISPRGLSSSFVRTLVCVEGIVTKCSLVRPKVMRSVHYCEETNKVITRNYVDATSTSGIPTPISYPTKDESGNSLVTEYGLSVYKDHQMITIQEMPERAPAGQLPRSVDIILENDLVDKVKPGDRVQAVGVYRALSSHTGQARGVFRTLLIANNVRQLNREISGPVLTDVDIANIRDLSKREDIFDLLSSSLAPSIFGHEFMKKSLLLLLLGGVERNLLNGTHLRGDINILMIGDPSTAKSQLLRFVLNIAPLAINTSGRGSSGVGLTAAVTSDPETGERRLEAGAMVLADRGVVCIDEFDKMSEDDRVAIHEVMEQQTVTIAKAGIHTSLNARCSVIAAANPVYGQYNRQKKPTDNIGLPDSLLSRFDLLFIVLDDLSPEHDRNISDHVLRMHRYRREGEYEGRPLSLSAVLGGEIDDLGDPNDDGDNENSGSTPVWQKFDKLLHGSRQKSNKSVVAIPFIQKYILYCKNRIKPRLSDEAKEFIGNAYSELRSKEDMKTLPVTVRSLETLIRLSEAHAKCRLSQEVELRDAKVAHELMSFALYHEAQPQPKKPIPTNTTTNNADNNTSNGDNKENEEDHRNGKRKQPSASFTSTATKRKASEKDPTEDLDFETQPDSQDNVSQDDSFSFPSQPSSSISQSQSLEIDQNRRREFDKLLNQAFGPRQGPMKRLRLEQIDEAVNKGTSKFSSEEILKLLGEMQDNSRIMITKGEYLRV